MKLAVVAVGRRAPAWVEAACADYLGRFDRSVQLTLHAVAEVRRAGAADAARARAAESTRLLEAAPAGSTRVLCDVGGTALACEAFAARLARDGAHGAVTILIGGADGVDERVRAAAAWRWSLSALTLPHYLARVVVVEQLYRAYSLWRGLPYHRAH
mgnify:CR=1 FL=1